MGELLGVGALIGWWVMSLNFPSYIVPSPLKVAENIGLLFFDPEFMDDTAISALRVATSVFVSVLLGSILALGVHWSPALYGIVHDRIKPFLNSFPSVGWAILAVIWFGNSSFSVIFVQVAILTPFCLINVSEGLRELDMELLEMGRSFTRHYPRRFWKIIIPLLLPYIISAMRIAYGVGWKIALISELFGADSGIGFIMLRAQITADVAMVFASCFAIVIIFMAGEKLIINPLSRLAEKK